MSNGKTAPKGQDEITENAAGNEQRPEAGREGAGNGPALSPDELEKLQTRARERDQYLDMLQRTRAEFENYQKRSAKEREQENRYKFGPLIFDLLPVLDNLERAVDAGQKAGETGPLVQGVGMVLNQFLELFKRYGVTRIEAQGKPFDPHLHQALMQQEVAGTPPNMVVQVIEQGFMNQDRVLRPSKVVVSK